MELHSNFTFHGEKDSLNGMQPTANAFHHTLEVTWGLTPWFETGARLL